MFKRIRDFPRRIRLAWRLSRDPDLLRRLALYEDIEVDADAMTRLVAGITASDELAEGYVDQSTLLLHIKDVAPITPDEARQVLNESRRAPANSVDVLAHTNKRTEMNRKLGDMNRKLNEDK